MAYIQGVFSTLLTTDTSASSLVVGGATPNATTGTGTVNAGSVVAITILGQLQAPAGIAIDGATPGTHGIKFLNSGATPVSTASNLYSPDGATLYFNGSQLATGSAVSGTPGQYAKFTGASTLGDSLTSEAGTTVTAVAGYKIQAGRTPGLLLGADANALTLTTATQKLGIIATPHYTNGASPVAGIIVNPAASGNGVYIGGGITGVNAATGVNIYTGATTTTDSGTLRMSIATGVQIGSTGTDPGTGNLNVTGSVTAGSFVGTITTANNVLVTDDNAYSSIVYPLWATAAGSSQPVNVSTTRLSWKPSTGAFTISGPISAYEIAGVSGNANAVVLGATTGSNAITNNTTKQTSITLVPYANAQQKVALFLASNNSLQDVVQIGGGTTGYNAATRVEVWGGAKNTDIGTLQATFGAGASTNGGFAVGSGASVTGNGNIDASGTITGATLVASGTTDSSSTSTGAIHTAGGVGVAKALYVGTTGNFAGVVTHTDTTDSTTTSTGSIVTSGGMGLAKAIVAGGRVTVKGDLLLVNPTTGTAAAYASFQNTSGLMYVGADSSAGTTFFAGNTAYSGVINATTSAGMSIASTNASGAIRFYTGGTASRWTMASTGDLSGASGVNFGLTGVGQISVATTATATGTAVVHNANGYYYDLASSRRFKHSQGAFTMTPEQEEEFLSLQPEHWDYLSDTEDGAVSIMAEDLDALSISNPYGRSPFVNYDNQGRPHSNRDYALIAALVQIVARQQARLTSLENR